VTPLGIESATFRSAVPQPTAPPHTLSGLYPNLHLIIALTKVIVLQVIMKFPSSRGTPRFITLLTSFTYPEPDSDFLPMIASFGEMGRNILSNENLRV
jgi:hypothetical protein